MTEGSGMTWRLALVIILCLLYLVVVVPLVATSRREAALVTQVSVSERTLTQTTAVRNAEIQSLRTDVAALRDRQAVLLARLPANVPTGLFDQVASRAQQSGISEFRYERKSDYVEKMQAGLYRVYRFTLQGRGSQDKLLLFLQSLQEDATSAIQLDNLTLTAVGKDWQMTAIILVYTLGS